MLFRSALLTNATNTTGGLATATAAISAFAGAISTYSGGAVASVTAAVTVGANNDKTGYSLSSSQTFSTTGSVGSVTGAVGSVTGAVGSVTSSVTVGTNNDKSGYSLTAGTGLGNQTSNITGNLSGSVGSVTGAVGSVTSRVTANVDQWNAVTVTGMPMPTYTQPTGFLAATFPATVSNLTAANVRTELSTELGRIDAAVSSRSSHTAADVWSVATRTLTAFGFSVTVGTNNDKTGYSLTAGTGLGNQTANITGSLSGSVGSVSGSVGSISGEIGRAHV